MIKKRILKYIMAYITLALISGVAIGDVFSIIYLEAVWSIIINLSSIFVIGFLICVVYGCLEE